LEVGNNLSGYIVVISMSMNKFVLSAATMLDLSMKCTLSVTTQFQLIVQLL